MDLRYDPSSTRGAVARTNEGFLAVAAQRSNVIVAGSSTPVTVLDREFDDETSATVDREFDIQLTETEFGILEDGVQIDNVAPGVVSLSGTTATRIADGRAVVNIRSLHPTLKCARQV